MRRSLATTCSIRSGSSPLISSPNSSSAAFSVRMSLPPNVVTPIPSMPSSVRTCTVKNSRSMPGIGGAPTNGSSSGRRTKLILTRWIFILLRGSVPSVDLQFVQYVLVGLNAKTGPLWKR